VIAGAPQAWKKVEMKWLKCGMGYQPMLATTNPMKT
jgi:hypothetical protein